MAKRCHWGPGFVDHEPPQAPPSKVVAWSWAKPIWIWNLEYQLHCKLISYIQLLFNNYGLYWIIIYYNNISWLINISYIQLLCNNHQSHRIRKIVVNDESSTIINYLCKECQVNHEVNGIKETLHPRTQQSSSHPTRTLPKHGCCMLLAATPCNACESLTVSAEHHRCNLPQEISANCKGNYKQRACPCMCECCVLGVEWAVLRGYAAQRPASCFSKWMWVLQIWDTPLHLQILSRKHNKGNR